MLKTTITDHYFYQKQQLFPFNKEKQLFITKSYI